MNDTSSLAGGYRHKGAAAAASVSSMFFIIMMMMKISLISFSSSSLWFAVIGDFVLRLLRPAGRAITE